MEGYLQQVVAEKADRYGLRAFADDAVEVFQRWMEEDEPDDNNPVNRQVNSQKNGIFQFDIFGEGNYFRFALQFTALP